MDTLLSQILIPTATAFLGALVTWFFRRRKESAEADAVEKDNEQKDLTKVNAAVDTWEHVVQALQGQIEKLLEQRKEDGARIEALSKQIVDLQAEVADMREKLRLTEKLEKKVTRYEKLLDAHGIAY